MSSLNGSSYGGSHYSINRRPAPVPVAPPSPVLSNDAIRCLAPSVFAESPWEGMSDRYRQVATIEVVDILRDKGFLPVLAGQSRARLDARRDFTKHIIKFRSESDIARMMDRTRQVGDEIPELVLTNSHDGTSAYQFMAGIFRLVCSNGAIVKSADFGTVSVKHVGREDFSGRILDATYQVVEALPNVMDKIEGWKQIELSRPQQEAFATAALELRDNPGRITPAQLLATRRHEDRKADLWTTSQVVQEHLIRGGDRGRNPETGRRVTTRAIKGVDADLRTNKALWVLTEHMSQLVTR